MPTFINVVTEDARRPRLRRLITQKYDDTTSNVEISICRYQHKHTHRKTQRKTQKTTRQRNIENVTTTSHKLSTNQKIGYYWNSDFVVDVDARRSCARSFARAVAAFSLQNTARAPRTHSDACTPAPQRSTATPQHTTEHSSQRSANAKHTHSRAHRMCAHICMHACACVAWFELLHFKHIHTYIQTHATPITTSQRHEARARATRALLYKERGARSTSLCWCMRSRQYCYSCILEASSGHYCAPGI